MSIKKNKVDLVNDGNVFGITYSEERLHLPPAEELDKLKNIIGDSNFNKFFKMVQID